MPLKFMMGLESMTQASDTNTGQPEGSNSCSEVQNQVSWWEDSRQAEQLLTDYG